LAALAALAARPAAQHLAIEDRIQQGWRWRMLSAPEHRAPSFRTVRPWRGGLIAVDDLGLAIFDGYEWTRPPGSQRFAVGELIDILPVSDGLFAVCDGKLVSLDEFGNQVTLATVPRPRELKPAFRRGPGSALVAVGDSIVEISTLAAGMHVVATLPPGAATIHSVAEDSDGALWAVTDTGLYRQHGGAWEPELRTGIEATRSEQFVRAVRALDKLYFVPESLDEASEARMWDGEELRVVEHGDKSVTVVDSATCPNGAVVLALNAPALGIIRDGVARFPHPALPSGDKLRSICFTEGGRLAVVCGSGELWVADLGSERWETYDPSVVGANQLVNALAPASDGGLWVGTHLGLAHFDAGHFTDVQTMAGDTNMVLRGLTAVAEDDEGRVWVGSGGNFRGALCLDHGRWTLYAGPDDLGSRFVHSIKRIGDDLWFAELDDDRTSYQEGQLVRLRDGVFTRYRATRGGRPLGRCYDVVARPDGTLFAGTSLGLLTLDGLDGDAWRSVSLPVLNNDRAFALHLREDGSLWIGLGLSHEGIIEMREGEPARRFQDEDWERAAAAAFCETGDGRLWFASENGLFLVVDEQCHEVTSGLPARNFWPMLPDGRDGLWLGSMGSGLVHFRPDDGDAPRTLPVDIRYTEDVKDTIATWGAADKWQATAPEELRFRLTLDGHPIPTTPEWSGTRQIHEANLGPLPDGHHDLVVTCIDALGNVEVHPLTKGFDVPAPEWRRPPMLAAMGALAVTMVIVGIVLENRRRERRAAQQRQAELAERLSVLTRRLFSSEEDERRKLSRELHDDLGQALTSIGLDLQIAERKGMTPEGRVAAERALATVRAAIDRVRAISSLLRPAVLDDLGLEQAVRTAMSEFTTRTGVDGQLEVELDGVRIPEASAGHVYRILQEALTNVARHAAASTVFVNLRATPERVELTVRDDGAGFSTAAVPTAKRFGLLGMRERSELMGGSFILESTPGEGTRVHVSIPLRPALEPV
jgi:signal transduction histidine kinase